MYKVKTEMILEQALSNDIDSIIIELEIIPLFLQCFNDQKLAKYVIF